MIEKIIIQDSNEVHSIWIPERKSLASFIVWKTFGLGAGGQWTEGQISLGTRADWADWPAYPEFPGYHDIESFPQWVGAHIALVDAALPSRTELLAALDPDSLTVMLDPPAYRIPVSPAAEELAACMLACRMMLALKDRLAGPTGVSSDELDSDLEYASGICVLIGSEASRRIALETARSTELCFIIPDGVGINDSITEEKADD